MDNTYDRTDTIRREAAIIAGPLKLAAYRVRDPETGEFGTTQFHATFDNHVLAVMGEGSARLFAKFVTDTLAIDNECPPGFSRCGFLVKPIGLGEDEWYRMDDVDYERQHPDEYVYAPLYCRTEDCDPFAWKASRMGEGG